MSYSCGLLSGHLTCPGQLHTLATCIAACRECVQPIYHSCCVWNTVVLNGTVHSQSPPPPWSHSHNCSSILEKVKLSRIDAIMGHGQKLVVLCLPNKNGAHWSTEMSELSRPPILNSLLQDIPLTGSGLFFLQISHVWNCAVYLFEFKSIVVLFIFNSWVVFT